MARPEIDAAHPNHISKSAIAALTLPEAPSAIIWVVEMGEDHPGILGGPGEG